MPRARFFLFLVAVFALKLIVVAELHDHPLLQPDSGIDTTAYVALAERVRGGDLALGPGLYFVSPLYIYWFAAGLALVHSFTAVRVLQAALGTAAVGCVFVAARAWFGARAAWFAASAAALTGIFTFYESLLLHTSLDPVLTSATLAALALALTRTGRNGLWFAVAGLASGLEILNRPNTIVAAAVVAALLVVRRRWQAAASLAAGAAIALAPAAVRNAMVAGEWSPLPSHGGLNFYIGNNPEADGTYHSVPGITPNIEGQERDSRRVAEQALGRPLKDAEVSNYFFRLGFAWIRGHPRDAAALAARKLGYTFSAVHVPLNDSYAFYAYDAGTLLAALIIGAWLLIPLGLAGLVVLAPRHRLADYAVWCSFVPAYAISVAAFFAADRYRLPLLIPMCVGAGAFADAIVPRRPQRGRQALNLNSRSRGLAARLTTVGAVLFVAVNWPLHVDDGRNEERTRMAEQSALAGDVAAANKWSDRAEESGGDAAVIGLRVGRALAQSGHPAEAVRHLSRAIERAPGRPEIEYALGQALLDADRPGDAIPHLRAAVENGVRADVAGADLVRALTAVGDRDGARQALATVAPANPADGASWRALGDLAVALDAPDLELGFYSRAAEADPTDPIAQLNLAVALAETGNVGEARRRATNALRLNPDYGKARQLLDALGK